MMTFKDEINRKRKNRNIALENLGVDNIFVLQKLDPGDPNQQKLNIEKRLARANMMSRLNVYRPLKSSRRFIGNVITFMKKVVRKLIHILLGWYFLPIIEQQSEFNAEMVATISSLRMLVYNLGEENKNNKYEVEKGINLYSELKDELRYIKQTLNITCDYRELETGLKIDYFEFENCFRGSEENVSKIQKDFVKYYKNRQGIVLDIGCGRGEFLKLMKKSNIEAMGIDVYPPFIEHCRSVGLNVQQQDIIMYLKNIEDKSLAGIFMSHVVEHLNTDYILKLIQLAYQKLQQGAYFILQTPNPEALFTLIDFWIDIEHKKPIHYRTLEFLFKQAGFESVVRYDPEVTKFHNVVARLGGDNIINLQEFNYGMDNLNQYLTGYQDYALIARK